MSKHRVVDLAQKAAVAETPLCELHKGKPKELFCMDCKVRCFCVHAKVLPLTLFSDCMRGSAAGHLFGVPVCIPQDSRL